MLCAMAGLAAVNAAPHEHPATADFNHHHCVPLCRASCMVAAGGDSSPCLTPRVAHVPFCPFKAKYLGFRYGFSERQRWPTLLSGIVETAVFPWLNRGRPGSTESYDGWRHSAGTQHPGADPPGK